jgi:hypothetical protein
VVPASLPRPAFPLKIPPGRSLPKILTWNLLNLSLTLDVPRLPPFLFLPLLWPRISLLFSTLPAVDMVMKKLTTVPSFISKRTSSCKLSPRCASQIGR